MKPLNGWLIIEPIKEIKEDGIEKSESGIFLVRHHNTPNTRLKKAKVLSISELFHEGRRWKTELTAGDCVLYDKTAVREVEEGEAKLTLVREVDVYIIL